MRSFHCSVILSVLRNLLEYDILDSVLFQNCKGKVVVSVVADPKDFDRLKPVLNSILDQTVRVDRIGVVVPLKNEKDVPEFIKNIANIFPAGKNYGDGTALIPILLKEKECDTIIIALSSNVIYGKDFIEKMVDESEDNPDTVLTDSKKTTLLVKPEYYDCKILDSKDSKYNHDHRC